MDKKIPAKPLCERCFRQISLKRDNYFEVRLVLHGKLSKISYIHKSCQDEIEKISVQQIKNINNLASQVPDLLKQIGIEPAETVYEIQ